jgi:hypothetical protein
MEIHPMLHRLTAGLLLFGLLAFATVRAADEDKDLVPKQKANAAEIWKKLEAKGELVETPNFFVYAAVPAAQAKAIGESLDKHFAVAYKALRFEDKEKPWQGKPGVYVLTERDEYLNFTRNIEKRSAGEDLGGYDVRSDMPFIVAGVGRTPDKTTTPGTRAAYWLSQAVLAGKAGKGTALPDWLREGFAWSVAARVNPAAYAAGRARMRTLVAGTKSVVDVYKGGLSVSGKDADLVGASLAEYLVFSPSFGPNFGALLSGLKAGENGESPAFESALESAKVSWGDLEKGWRKYVATGR